MRRSLLVAAVVLAGLAGAAVAALPVAERWLAARIKESLEHDGTARADAVAVDLLERRVVFTGLSVRFGLELRIGQLEAAGLAWPLAEMVKGEFPLTGWHWGDPLNARRLDLTKVKLASRSNELQWDVDRITIEDAVLARHTTAMGRGAVAVNRVARAFLALSVGRVDVGTVRGSVPLSGGRDAGVGGLTLEGYDRGHVRRLVVTGAWGAAFDKEPPPVTLADLTLKGLSVGRVLTAMSSETWVLGGPSGRISMDSLSASGFGGELLRRYGVSVGGIGLATTHDSATRSRTRLQVDDVLLAPPLSGLQAIALRMTLQSMGLNQVKAGFACTAVEDRGAGEIAIDDCALQASGLATVRLGLRIVNGDEALWQALDEGDLLLLSDSGAGLASVRLVATDQSLLERSARAFAAMTRQPLTPAIRAGWAREVRRYQPPGVMISQAMTQLLDTVARFVEQGGTLTIEAKPERPVGLDRFDYLAGPGADLVSALGVSATLK